MTEITDIGLTEIIAGQNDRTRFDQAALKEQGDDQPRLIRTLEFEYYAIQRAVCPPVLDTHAQRTLYPLASLAAGYQERSLTVKPVTKDPTFRCPTCGQAFYKTADAANYLEMNLSTFKYHFHTAKNVRPLVDVDRRLALFVKQKLDEFEDNRRLPGRPRKETKICLVCGELVPQGCCTCGPRQRLEATNATA